MTWPSRFSVKKNIGFICTWVSLTHWLFIALCTRPMRTQYKNWIDFSRANITANKTTKIPQHWRKKNIVFIRERLNQNYCRPPAVITYPNDFIFIFFFCIAHCCSYLLAVDAIILFDCCSFAQWKTHIISKIMWWNTNPIEWRSSFVCRQRHTAWCMMMIFVYVQCACVYDAVVGRYRFTATDIENVMNFMQ